MNQENNFNLQGNNGMPNNQPLNSNQVVWYDSQTGQPIYASQNNSLDDKLLMAFIGNNYEQIMQQKFSVPALFLSWIYTLYRKIYIPSIIGMGAIILLGFLPSIIYTIIVFAFVIVLGINFNKWYVAYAKKQVEKIKMSNQNINENELINICKKKGGTNIWLAILIYAVFAIVSGFLNPNVNNLYKNESDGDNDNCSIVVDTDTYFVHNINRLKNSCENFEVSYENIKFVAQKNTYENYEAYTNKIYYNNKELKYISNDDVINSNLTNAYLLYNPNGKNSFLFMFHEVPVPQMLERYIILFNELGEIKFLDTATSSISFDEETKTMEYSTIKEDVRTLMNITCDSIKDYNEDKVYSTEYTYKYENGEMNLINSKDTTMRDLKIQNGCN